MVKDHTATHETIDLEDWLERQVVHEDRLFNNIGKMHDVLSLLIDLREKLLVEHVLVVGMLARVGPTSTRQMIHNMLVSACS